MKSTDTLQVHIIEADILTYDLEGCLGKMIHEQRYRIVPCSYGILHKSVLVGGPRGVSTLCPPEPPWRMYAE